MEESRNLVLVYYHSLHPPKASAGIGLGAQVPWKLADQQPKQLVGWALHRVEPAFLGLPTSPACPETLSCGPNRRSCWHYVLQNILAYIPPRQCLVWNSSTMHLRDIPAFQMPKEIIGHSHWNWVSKGDKSGKDVNSENHETHPFQN